MAGSSVLGRPGCYQDEDECASLASMEAGFSGKSPAICSPSFGRRRPTYRALAPSGFSHSPRSARFLDSRFEEAHHFLDACFLCKKTLSQNKDIFMYRGDTPFCSEDCRQEQIEIDESREKNWNMSSFKVSASSRKENQRSSTKQTHDYHVRTGTVAAG